MQKVIKAWVVTAKTSWNVRKFYGYGEWCFTSLEEAEKYQKNANSSTSRKTQYIIRPVTVHFDQT